MRALTQAEGGESGEIELGQISAADSILIHTRNSEYRFSIVDPVQRRGILSGGTFGDYLHDATLIGALIPGSDLGDGDTSWLRTNSRALFYVRAESGIRRFTTSIITRLIHIKNGGDSNGID